MLRQRLIYTTLLTVLSFIIWRLLYTAQFEEYDDNMANILLAFFISVLGLALLTFMWFRWRKLIRHLWLETLIFIVVSSPITIGLSIIYYSEIFGVTLRN